MIWSGVNLTWGQFDLLPYFHIDYNCFVNQLYHKTQVICKKKQGDFNFAREGDISWYMARISPSSPGLMKPARLVTIKIFNK